MHNISLRDYSNVFFVRHTEFWTDMHTLIKPTDRSAVVYHMQIWTLILKIGKPLTLSLFTKKQPVQFSLRGVWK